MILVEDRLEPLQQVLPLLGRGRIWKGIEVSLEEASFEGDGLGGLLVVAGPAEPVTVLLTVPGVEARLVALHTPQSAGVGAQLSGVLTPLTPALKHPVRGELRSPEDVAGVGAAVLRGDLLPGLDGFDRPDHQPALLGLSVASVVDAGVAED